MNPDKQRIAIAEACGWTVELKPREGAGGSLGILRMPNGGIASTWHGNGIKTLRNYVETYYKKHCLPDYLNDLNAMHEAEKIFKPEQCYRYRDELVDGCDDSESVASWPFHATAAQRAEAFLRAIGKWEEDET